MCNKPSLGESFEAVMRDINERLDRLESERDDARQAVFWLLEHLEDCAIYQSDIVDKWREPVTQMVIKIITIGDEWPDGISDGLTLLCPYCNQVPCFDYTVTDECWEAVVPKDNRLGVVCLPCLDMLAVQRGVDISQSIERMQFTGVGKTIVFVPEIAYKWKVKACHRAAPWRMK